MPLAMEALDHVHVYVADRAKSARWYQDVLHMYPSPELVSQAEGRGPLTIQNTSGTVHLALFERPAQPCRSVVAIRVHGSAYKAWKTHLESAWPGQ